MREPVVSNCCCTAFDELILAPFESLARKGRLAPIKSRCRQTAPFPSFRGICLFSRKRLSYPANNCFVCHGVPSKVASTACRAPRLKVLRTGREDSTRNWANGAKSMVPSRISSELLAYPWVKSVPVLASRGPISGDDSDIWHAISNNTLATRS
jgi:hypothetical protein